MVFVVRRGIPATWSPKIEGFTCLFWFAAAWGASGTRCQLVGTTRRKVTNSGVKEGDAGPMTNKPSDESLSPRVGPTMKKLRALWASSWGDVDRRVRLGRLLGLAFIVLGFVAIGKAWDGAASRNFIQQQFPYLLSGGFLGIGLIITGSMLIFMSTLRAERQILSDRYEEMAKLLSRNLSRLQVTSTNGSAASGEQVVAGANAYHRPGCSVLQGKEGLMNVTVEQAAAEGLGPCRVCDPPKLAETTEKAETKSVEKTESESPTT
jgi:hypothetical protein